MLDDDEILSIVGNELSQSMGGTQNDSLQSNRENALAYYLGLPDGKEVQGRSSVVSTDVADAIEWILPEVIEQLTKNNEVVTFDANFEGDERQAELETQFVFDTVMKDNPGFLIYHQVIKDALLQKNGISKVMYEENSTIEVDRFTGIGEEALSMLTQQDSVEIVEKTGYENEEAKAQIELQFEQQMQQYQMMQQQMQMQPQQPGMPPQQMPPPPEMPPIPMLYDVKVRIREEERKVAIYAVPPEEFRINQQHNSPDPTTARFTAHVVLKSASDLIRSGIPKDVVDELPRVNVDNDQDRQYRFSMQQETYYGDGINTLDPSQEMIEVAECFMHIDIDDDGVSEFCKIEVAGGDDPTHLLRIEEMSLSDHPFGSALAIIMSHKFSGLSIYDRLRQIQNQKTALWRNILDNIYLQNNQRLAVTEGMVNLDDLMLSRPGGIVRQKVPGSVEPIVTPPIGGDAYQMMDYLDQVRAGRVGVSPEGQIQVDNIGDRVGSEGIEKLMTAKEAIVGLMIRVIAETWVKPLMIKTRNLLRKHADAVYDIKFKDQWVSVNPSEWAKRDRTTVRVGTGSGNNRQQLESIMTVIQDQMAIKQDPMQTLVSPQEVFNARRTFCNVAGLPGASPYYLDPGSQQGQEAAQQTQQMSQEQQQKEEQERQAMIEMQNKVADAELGKARAALETVQVKAEAERLKTKISALEAALSEASEEKQLAFDYDKMRIDAALKLTEIETKEKVDLNKQVQQNKEAVNG
jgi:hypothetical protein